MTAGHSIARRRGSCSPGRIGTCLSGDEYRQLAQILRSRGDADKKINRVIGRLQDYGAYEDFRSQPPDWSFRTDPRGTREHGRSG